MALDAKRNELGLDHETVWLRVLAKEPQPGQRLLFPEEKPDPGSIFCQQGKGIQAAMNKTPGGNDNYYPEGKIRSFKPSYKLGRGTSALANLPADTESFPATTWFRSLLEKGVQSFVLNSQIIRQPSPPGLGHRFQTDGSNLPWVVATLERTLGWGADESVRDWPRNRGFAFHENQKPSRPKEAMEAVLRELRTPRSSALYRRIAGRISLRRCTDPAFQRLRQQLATWFPGPR